MKASTPSLILFFITSALVVLFKLLHYDDLVLCGKSIIIPSLFIYYLVSNNYKISHFHRLIFTLLFGREIFTVLNVAHSALGSFMCILLVYILLLFLAQKVFGYLKFTYKDFFSISIPAFAVVTICYSVLNLELENLELNFYLYVFFGAVVSILGAISIINYVKIGGYHFFNAMMMSVCFIFTDTFFMLYKFYYYSDLFISISISTQFLSYFFLANYLLEKDKFSNKKYKKKIKVQAKNLDDLTISENNNRTKNILF